jgi:hypothetical protein
MSALILPTGVQFRAYPPPPGSWEALLVDEQALRQCGLPVRPRDPRLATRWDSARGWLKRYDVAMFVANPGKVHGPRRASFSPNTSTNWSGTVLRAPASKTIKWIHGHMSVPDAMTLTTKDTTSAHFACSVGLDGNQSQSPLRAGIHCELRSVDGKVERILYAWCEWFPEMEVSIGNLPVNPGDAVNCTICVENDARTKASVMFGNLTQAVCTSFQISAPAGTSLKENCGEWVVSRPELNGMLQPLARFGTIRIMNAGIGLTDAPENEIEAVTGEKINMVDEQGRVLSSVAIEADGLKCTS